MLGEMKVFTEQVSLELTKSKIKSSDELLSKEFVGLSKNEIELMKEVYNTALSKKSNSISLKDFPSLNKIIDESFSTKNTLLEEMLLTNLNSNSQDLKKCRFLCKAWRRIKQAILDIIEDALGETDPNAPA